MLPHSCKDLFSYLLLKGPLLASSLNICHILDIAKPLAIFVKIASLQGVGTFIAIIASPLAIFAKTANFAKIASFAKIGNLQGASFGIQFKSPEAGNFSPFSPLRAFLDISENKSTSSPCLLG